jgi:acyl-[acyl-carrier-protein]-phospholipid O-acyltransferase/long-chain-fatty-acid--[acyl-carrier-protein] ligase
MQYKLEQVPGIEKGGRLLIKGPNVMLGYLTEGNPGVIQKPHHMIDGKDEYGWYDTGDIVEVDEESYITILGRAKRFAKVGGEMVSLLAIEEVATELWPKHLHAVISKPDESKGEVLIAYTTNPDATIQELGKYIISKGYPQLFVPRQLLKLDEIPVLGTGKINYPALMERLKKGE